MKAREWLIKNGKIRLRSMGGGKMEDEQMKNEKMDIDFFLSHFRLPEEISTLSLPELKLLAKAVRNRIVEVTSQVGGHLASSLGAVDFTLALYHVFNPTEYKIIWDVGHQAYTHKILTHRNSLFSKIGQRGGVAKFLRREESPYDYFGAGHASTSISAALGMAIAQNLEGENKKVIAIIGDGALTGGLAFEALNHLGHLQKNFLVIVNDNSMSIGSNVGALSKTFNRIKTHQVYNLLRNTIKPWEKGKALRRFFMKSLQRVNGAFMELLSPKQWVEALHIQYFGPFDGHNLEEMIAMLKTIKTMQEPVMLHLRTQKGKGYPFAEKDSLTYHGVTPFHPENGQFKKKGVSPKTYTKIWSETFHHLFFHDEKTVAISAAMIDSVGLTELYASHPHRIFDVGIAEAHAVCLSAGMACQNLKPFVVIYSTFLQRAFDQLVHDVALQNLPVRFILDRAGFVGADGATHNGVFDLSYLRCIPNFVVMAPRNGEELAKMVITAYLYNQGPIALRFPRGEAGENVERNPAFFAQNLKNPIPIGQGEVLKRGEGLALISIGTMAYQALALAEKLKAQNFNPWLVDARFVKPLDKNILSLLAKNCKLIVTLEENTSLGGFGSAILEHFSQNPAPLTVLPFGIKDSFIEYGILLDQMTEAGLQEEKIIQQILARWKSLA